MDIVTGKKKPQQNDDERLQLLPERRSRKPLKDVSHEINSNSTTAAAAASSDPGSPLFQSISFLIDELKLLNYSGNIDYKEQIVLSGNSNSFEKAVNDLFIDDEEIHVG